MPIQKFTGLPVGNVTVGVAPVAATVQGASSGALYTITRLLGGSSTLSLITGTDANLTLTAGSTITAGTGIGLTTQTAEVREVLGQLALEYPVMLTGNAVAALANTSLTNLTAGLGRRAVYPITGASSGSTLAISGAPTGMAYDQYYRGLVGTPTSSVGNYALSITETNAAYPNSPKTTGQTLVVNNALAPLALSLLNTNVGASKNIQVYNTTAGSTLSISAGALPAGMTLDSTNRQLIGTVTAAVGSYTFTLDETLAGATGSPKSTSFTITVTAAVNAVVVQMGDSIGVGANYGYPALSNLNFGSGVTIVNNSVSGRQVAELPEEYPNGIAGNWSASKPSIVILSRSQNDSALGGRSAAQIYADQTALANFYKGQGYYTIVTTMTPRNYGFGVVLGAAATEQNCYDYNDLVRANSGGFDRVIDVFTIVGGRGAGYDTTQFPDGLHIIPDLQKLLVVAFDAAIVDLAALPVRAQKTTLTDLTLSNAQPVVGQSWTATIRGKGTQTSNVVATASDGTVLTVTGNGTTGGTVSGTFNTLANESAPVTITLTQSLGGAGAANEGRQSKINAVVAAAPAAIGTAVDPLSLTSESFVAARRGSGFLARNGARAQVPTTIVPATGISTAWAMSCWVKSRKLTQAGTSPAAIAVQTRTGNGTGIFFGFNAGAVFPFIQVNGGPTIVSNASIADDLYHHIAVQFDPGNTLTLWVDGVSKGSSAMASPPASLVNPMTIGQQDVFGYMWNGIIDDFSFWSGVKFNAAFTPALPTPGDSQLLAHYTLDSTGAGYK